MIAPRSSSALATRSRPSLTEWIATHSPYVAYTYSYPHKTAYRPLQPRSLEEVWAAERREALFLYLHVPFCETRCGYCNLFSHACRDDALQLRYVEALERQATSVMSAIAPARFAQVAIGGGTPTQLAGPLLKRLFDVAEREMGASLSDCPVSLETSPATASSDKLSLALERGVDRVSIGVQSFVDDELRALHRHHGSRDALRALERIRDLPFSTLNIDLIYGVRGQTAASWSETLDSALAWAPEELYLYPLYVRPLTGLGRAQEAWPDLRIQLYRQARERLVQAGYRQVSMRMFRRAEAGVLEAPQYQCQEDGMVGLGCGARSYTWGLHYSDAWAVGASGVREILQAWVERSGEGFAKAHHGFVLDDNEQRARYLLKSLLRVEGLDRRAYQRLFGADAFAAHPALQELAQVDLLRLSDSQLALTERGLELTDCIGPWLYTDRVNGAMGGYELR